MANPNQSRDSRGRFQRSGGNTTEDRRSSKERDADRKRVERAKTDAAIADTRDSLATITRELQANTAARPTRRDDPHDVVSWEQDRAFLRERQRKLREKLRTLGIDRRRH